MEQIAKACPMLEELELGLHWLSNMKIDDVTLLSLPIFFSHLKSVRFKTFHITNERRFERILPHYDSLDDCAQ